jgi:zinc protease
MKSISAGPLFLAVAMLLSPLVPLDAQDTGQARRETPPAAGTPKPFRVPPRRTITLGNGMKLTLVPYGRVPKTAIELELRTGSIDEGPTDVSLGAVTADMLLEGSATRSAQDISRQAAEMGGALSATSGAEAVSIGGEVLSSFATGYVALIADVVRNPRFAEADLKRILDKHVRDNAIALSQPGALAQKKFREISYGDHPFARILPEESIVRGFTVERVRAFHGTNYGAARAHLYVSGVFNASAIEKAVREAFDSWAAGSPATVNPPVPVARRQLEVIDRPASVQSSMWLGLPVSDPSKTDWLALAVTDALLGGAFGSRITANIREAKGYTYSPFSFVWSRKGAAHWVEVADVTTNVTGPALQEIIGEMERLRADAPPEQELTGIKNNLAGVFTVQNSSRSGLIGQLQFSDLHGLGEDYLRNYVSGILAITPADVRATAQKHLDPTKLSIAIVGDKKVIEPQLGAFKPIVP